ncbi:hypothetical protein KY290_036373 [Solanum tuberosum]|uniref:CCHC-type domain-containing protein n=1 Tax=Solanum tuberosum TaxID=4113 RepID=A0ABQ7TTA5_SOLTU|nr:hypothetical protein KY290_036373 [Solanum tuberosum]
MLMENFLRSKEYWPIVEDGINTPAEGKTLTNAQKAELEEKNLKDLKAKNYLFQAIDRPILETILCKETSKDIWDSMKKIYQGTARMKRAQFQSLRRDFETLQMKEGESVMSYCARTMEISNKMRFHGEKMNDVIIVDKILRSLTPKYDYVICSTEESKDIDELSLDELQSPLLVHEQKMNRNSTSEEQALKASTFIPSNYRGRGRGRGRGDRRNREGGRNFRVNDDNGKGRGKNFDKSKVECYRCHKFGHYQSECYTRLPNEKDEKSNFVESKETETLLMATQAHEEPLQDVWYLDTGCSNHMSGRQLQEKGYFILIGKGVCEIFSPTREAIVVVKMNSNRLFPLTIESIKSCLKAEAFQKFSSPPKFVKNVLLANNIVLNFQKGSRGEQKQFWNWCI